MMSRAIRFGSHAMLAALLAGVAAGPAFAADATFKQVYAEAKSGDVDGALTMMAPVLKDHPNSARAHYVEAELLVHAHRIDDARGELAKAKSIDPGLQGISSHSVTELEAAVNGPVNGPAAGTTTVVERPVVQHGSGIPWGLIIIVGLVIFGIVALMRRRSAAVYAPTYGGAPGAAPGYGPGYGAPGYGGPGYGGPGYGGGMGGGMGGGIMGGLASGAAMGAGFAVGEEVVDHMFGGERREGNIGGGGYVDGGSTGGEQRANPDADMGGNDFGISGDSWDDGSSGGGGGDDSGW